MQIVGKSWIANSGSLHTPFQMFAKGNQAAPPLLAYTWCERSSGFRACGAERGQIPTRRSEPNTMSTCMSYFFLEFFIRYFQTVVTETTESQTADKGGNN